MNIINWICPKKTSWWFVLLSPSRWLEAVVYLGGFYHEPSMGCGDKPDPRDIASELPLQAWNRKLPSLTNNLIKAIKLGWKSIKQSINACTAYAKGNGVEIENTIEHGKAIYIDKEKQWEHQMRTGGSRASGDWIQNAEKQFHDHSQGFPQTEYRRLRGEENTVQGVKLWLTFKVTIRTGIYWRWSSKHKITNSRYMKETGFFTPGEGPVHGGHAILIVDYDDNRICPDGSIGAFKIKESEEMTWGENEPGIFWASYKHFDSLFSKYLSRDTWDL